MAFEVFLLTAGIYIVLGRWMVGLRGRGCDPLFAVLNVAAVYVLFFFASREPRFRLLCSLYFVAYLAIISIQFVAMRLWSRQQGWKAWIAFFVPIAVLVGARWIPLVPFPRLISPRFREVLQRHPEFALNVIFVGISYMAFRTSYLVLQVRNGLVKCPNYSQYMGFAFFLPTMSVGPINPYSLHRRAFEGPAAPPIPVGRSALRILVGGVKYRFFGPLLNQLTYSGLLLDGHPHLWIDFPIAVIAYYLFLYCNFSGFCDVAIGSAGLMRISMAENFNDPFAARNAREFWNRWHITLSHYMRDVVFNPLSKVLVRRMGPRNSNHAIAITIMIVFLLIGIWHGFGWNYAAFGAMHGIGVAGNHYYTIMLKQRLGKDRFLAYNRSALIHAIAVCATFLFVAASLFLFANDWQSMKDIFSMLRT